MSIERIEQTRKIKMFEVTVAINEPLKEGPIDMLDALIDYTLSRIEKLILQGFKKGDGE